MVSSVDPLGAVSSLPRRSLSFGPCAFLSIKEDRASYHGHTCSPTYSDDLVL